MKVFLDTNVLIIAFATRGLCADLMRLLLTEHELLTGEVNAGTVAGITPRGVFVELDNTVEGFVPAAQLCKGEPQVIDGVSMLDPLTGKSWMLGSSMKIRVAAADVALGRIDFEYMVE